MCSVSIITTVYNNKSIKQYIVLCLERAAMFKENYSVKVDALFNLTF